MPEGSSARINRIWPDGRASLSFAAGAALPPGPAEFVRLAAEVPSSAPYGQAHVLDVTLILINGGDIVPGIDQAVHVTAFFGDATGNGEYSGLDAQRIARVTVGIDSGLEAYPRLDPLIVGDITSDGSFSGLDAQRIAQAAVGLTPSEIPPLPGEGGAARSSPPQPQPTDSPWPQAASPSWPQAASSPWPQAASLQAEASKQDADSPWPQAASLQAQTRKDAEADFGSLASAIRPARPFGTPVVGDELESPWPGDSADDPGPAFGDLDPRLIDALFRSMSR
jgi:hypothetical protein